MSTSDESPSYETSLLRKRNPPIDPQLLEFARELRRLQTDAEDLLSELLRDRRFHGVKFRRQHPLDHYVIDFYCDSANLAIELDGGQHNTPEGRHRDIRRTRFIESRGITIVRFWNNEILAETEAVLEGIWKLLHERGVIQEEIDQSTPSSPLSSRERGRG